MRLITTLATIFIMAILALSACSSSPQSSGNSALTSDEHSCKDFPVVIYPSVTFKTCEKKTPYENTPVSYVAYVESADSVQKVTKFYKTQVQKDGWTVQQVEGESATHAVVNIKKGIAHASIIINKSSKKKGSSFQIHAFPFGN